MSRPGWVSVCVVSGCGKLQEWNSRCGEHAKLKDEARGSRHERGYDSGHDKIRQKLLAELRKNEMRSVVVLCHRCLKPMHTWHELDADHSKVLASEGGKADCLTHAACNRGKILPG